MVEEELPMGWGVSITLDRDHFRSDLIYIKLVFIAFMAIEMGLCHGIIERKCLALKWPVCANSIPNNSWDKQAQSLFYNIIN